MNDLIVAAGLVLVFEGLIWAISAGSAIRLLSIAAATPERTLRLLGVACVTVGCFIVWLVRG